MKSIKKTCSRIKSLWNWTRLKGRNLLKTADPYGLPSREEQDKQPKTWWGGSLSILGFSLILAYAIYALVQFAQEYPTVKTSVALTTNYNSTTLNSSNFYLFFQAENGSSLNSSEMQLEDGSVVPCDPLLAPVPAFTPSYPISLGGFGSSTTTTWSYKNDLCSADRFQVTFAFLNLVSFDSTVGTIQAVQQWSSYSFYLNQNETRLITITMTPQSFWYLSRWPWVSPNVTTNYAASVGSSEAWVYDKCSPVTGFNIQFSLAAEQQIGTVSYDTDLLDVFSKIGGISSIVLAVFSILYKILSSGKTIIEILAYVFCCRCCKKKEKKAISNQTEGIKYVDTSRPHISISP